MGDDRRVEKLGFEIEDDSMSASLCIHGEF